MSEKVYAIPFFLKGRWAGMNLAEISVFNIASRRMDWLGQRQQVVAQNVANSDTPGYRAREIASFAEILEAEMPSSEPMVTNPFHLFMTDGAGTADVFDDPLSVESKLDGNTVNLEREAIKSDEIASSFAMAVNIYRKSSSLLGLAITGRA
jgi:flagellar basal-body rod protein FlgB